MAAAQLPEMVRWEKDSDNVVTLTFDAPGASTNTMDPTYTAAMAAALDRLEAEIAEDPASVTGVIITSAKKTFFAGGDLNLIMSTGPDQAEEFTAEMAAIKAGLRRLETLGRPVVAAINGAALGGGLEIALACHHRIAVDAKGSQIGLPEASLGLLPGAGGIVRTVRMLGIAEAMTKVLVQGQRHKPREALEVGLVDEVVDTAEQMLTRARAWIAENPEAVQPWDAKGYKIPGGTPASPAFAMNLPAFPANLRKQVKGAPTPAPRNILAAAVESAQVDIDTAMAIETRYLVDLVTSPVAKNMIQAFFFDLQAVNGGTSRPDGHETYTAKKTAVLGAGMMGAGIAYVCARAGMQVVLKDVSTESAEKGKNYSVKLCEKAVSRGKMTQDAADELLARITPTDQPSDAAGADLVIEAVFENPELKHKVFAEIEPVVAPDALLGSNTSSLPITGLAQGVSRAEDFIGLHFFSPVDKMPLLEIVAGEKTSETTLAKAFDVARQIRKTPIVVNDSQGFFTSRVIGTFLNEAVAMVGEGIHPQTIEQACTQAGYPVGALALSDELTLSLMRKIRAEAKRALGDESATWASHPSDPVMDRMIDEFDRPGRSAGKGFYDYADGKRTRLWPGLAEHFGKGEEPTLGSVDLHELQERMLFVEALETVRCFDEGVLRSSAEANIGSIMGIGYPPWTGGVVQYIAGYPGGPAGFVARARELAAAHGRRFDPPESLVSASAKGEIVSAGADASS